ncbi:mitochondrial 18 KDa protein-domain-containing protein [Mycena albidolilacea]|uniref:Mitochondrial fission process protein 1 n=1 Tax=Mycena albidolilacea TaxID=1033008 RepID=A0AAD7F611_9AGAR|nr:mitochondrial 18 KDa protein-domain-containing protein [Mycena albidolilacea]
MSNKADPVPDTIAEALKDEVDALADENVATTDSELRYAAYGARLRTALRAGTRYVAYTSDIGEAFRPVVPAWVVTAAYGISWLYLGGDVSYESYKAHRRGPTALEAAHFSEPVRIGMVAVERATFQSIASMALPALTIHTAVKQAKKAFDKVQNPRVRTWGPTFTGLAIVPVLPYLFDHPVEHVTDTVFSWIRLKLAEQQSKPNPRDEL